MLLMLRYQVLVHWSPKKSMIHTNNVLRRRLKMLTEKIPNASGLVKKTDNNTKLTKIESKMLSVTDLVATAAINTKDIESKVYTDITKLAAQTALNTKATEIQSKIPKLLI